MAPSFGDADAQDNIYLSLSLSLSVYIYIYMLYYYIPVYIYIYIIYIHIVMCIYVYVYIYIYIHPEVPPDFILISETHNLCSTYIFVNVICMLNISHDMQHVVGCPTWEHSHPNRCWVSKWERGYLNRCSVSKMGTWLSKSMFEFFQN